MNLNENIYRIQSLLSEDKEEVIKRMVNKIGLIQTIKMMGNYYKIEPYLKVIDKVNFIKEKIDEISEELGSSGFSLYELNEPPIFYDKDDNELKQIEYLGKDSVYVDVYNDDGDTHLGDFTVTYEGLPVEIIEELVEILLNS
jgi:hypothetical protein